jgi:hypothetical protein
MVPNSDPKKRTRGVMMLALEHFHDSQELERSEDVESAKFELGMAEEYREIFWRRTAIHQSD